MPAGCRAAKRTALKAADNMAEAIAPMAAAMPEMADAFLTMPVFARIRFGAWDEILKMPAPKEVFKMTAMFWHYARALAMNARGDRGGAAKEQGIFEAGRKMVPADAPWGINNKAADVFTMASEILAARLAASPAEAIPHWQRAVDLENALHLRRAAGLVLPGARVAGSGAGARGQCRPRARRSFAKESAGRRGTAGCCSA